MPAADVLEKRSVPSTSLYGSALAGAATSVRHRDGTLRPLASSRWLGPARGADLALLDRARGPVLDVGCGPGRLLVELQHRRVPALGIAVAPAAVRLTRRAGAVALRRCVFEPLPGFGRWRTVLLADGNIGIGGDPPRLLRRVHDLLLPDGRALLELAPPGEETGRQLVRLEAGSQSGPWFWWSQVSADDLLPMCAGAGLHVVERWSEVEGGHTRQFAVAARPRAQL